MYVVLLNSVSGWLDTQNIKPSFFSFLLREVLKMQLQVGKYGYLQLLGHKVHFYRQTDEPVYTEVYMLFRGTKKHLWFLGQVGDVHYAQSGLACVVSSPEGSWDVLLKRHAEGFLNNPLNFLRATKNKMRSYLKGRERHALQIRTNHREMIQYYGGEEEAAKALLAQYREEGWDAPPSMDEIDYLGGPR